MKTKCNKCQKDIIINTKHVLEKLKCDFCESSFFILSCNSCKQKFKLAKYPTKMSIKCKKCKSSISVDMDKRSVFISYAHKDEKWKDEILSYLQFYENDGVTVWTDRELQAGDQWSNEIETAINNAKIVILLITINFFNSNFIKKRELPYIYKRFKQGHLKIFPVIVKECSWKNHEIIPQFQARPLEGIPLEKVNKDNLSTELTKIADEVKSLLEPALIENSQSLEKISTQAPNIHLLCNRKDHALRFYKFFISCMKKLYKTPQFYFVHGNENEGHLSLIERFKNTTIKSHVKKFLQNSITPYHVKVGGWPQKDSLEFQQQRLIFDLIGSITESKSYFEIESLEQLIELPQVKPYKDNIFIVSHYLKASEFNSNLISWYINSFWKQGYIDYMNNNSLDNMPQFLIFFNVKYGIENNKSFLSKFSNPKTKAKKQLEKFLTSLSENQPDNPTDINSIFLLDELEPITKKDFHAWFIDYKNDINEKQRLKLIDIFFKNNETKPMVDVEPFLEKICVKYQYKERN